MKKTVKIEGKNYTVATFTAGVNRAFPDTKDVKEFQRNMVVSALKCGGHEDAEDIADNVEDGPFDANSPYKQIHKAAMEVNGYREIKGEAGAGTQPAQEKVDSADQTGESSTEDSALPLAGDIVT